MTLFKNVLLIGMIAFFFPGHSYAQTVLKAVCTFVDCAKVAIETMEDAYKRYEPDMFNAAYTFPTASAINNFSDAIQSEIASRNENGVLISISLYKVFYEDATGELTSKVHYEGIRVHGYGRTSVDAVFKGELFSEDGFLVSPNNVPTNIEIIRKEHVATSGFWINRSDGGHRLTMLTPTEMSGVIRKAYDRHRAAVATSVIIGNRDAIASLVSSSREHLQVSRAAIGRSKNASFISRLRALDESREDAEREIAAAIADYHKAVRDAERSRGFAEVARIIGVATSVVNAYNSTASLYQTSAEYNYSSMLRNIEKLNGLRDQKRQVILGETKTDSVRIPGELSINDVDLSDQCCTLERHKVTIFTVSQ